MHPSATCSARNCMCPVIPPQTHCSRHWQRIGRQTQIRIHVLAHHLRDDGVPESDELRQLLALANAEILTQPQETHA